MGIISNHNFTFKKGKHMKLNRVIILISLTLCLFYHDIIFADTQIRKGKIKGIVTDADTKAPLVGANVMIKDSQRGAATDENGMFVINEVPIGNYIIQFNYMGYKDYIKTDIIVRSKRITYCNVELNPSVMETDVIVVSSGYFSKTEDSPTSTVNFSAEEIRRAPGSAGDVSRIIFGLPSVAKVSDAQNALIVRGGSSFETGFYIDNIEVPNINHYPEYGSSGGPIGMLNVDLIKDVNFYSGGFSSIYNDKMSAVMELSFREGNRDEYDGQLDFSFAGAGLVGEGPIGSGKGSWLLTLRKSYLDLIVEAIGQSKNAVPNYGDMQAKIVYDLNTNHKITFLDILGIDEIHNSRESALEDEMGAYSDYILLKNTAGLNWRYLWNKKGYSNTSFSHTLTSFDYVSYDTRVYRDSSFEKKIFDFKPHEHEYKFRNINSIILNTNHKVQIGAEAKYLSYYQDNYYGEYNDDIGREIPAFKIDDKLSVTQFFGFFNYNWRIVPKIAINPGLSVSHFTYNENTYLSPRLNISYKMSDKTNVYTATGLYYQNLPISLLVQNESNKDLKDPKAYHYIVGMSHLLTENTKLTIEVYDKEYKNLPIDPLLPTFCVLDQIVRYGMYYNPNLLEDSGTAYTRGIEFMVQKKLAQDIYGMISASYFRAKYRDYNGFWRNRDYDNRLTLNFEGGYKPNNKWEFSLRWIYAGGRPYTPFDEGASETISRGVYDASFTNENRLPDYHSLDIRCDRRYNFSGSNLIMYFAIWNTYGRNNISMYYWDGMKNKKVAVKQWSLLPIFGLEFEF
jgi:outer membrane receptor for ferrienterochelin and colicin